MSAWGKKLRSSLFQGYVCVIEVEHREIATEVRFWRFVYLLSFYKLQPLPEFHPIASYRGQEETTRSNRMKFRLMIIRIACEQAIIHTVRSHFVIFTISC